MAINLAKDFCKKNSHLAPKLPDDVLLSSPVDAMDEAIFLNEILTRLSGDERLICEFIFLGYTEIEMAARLGIR